MPDEIIDLCQRYMHDEIAGDEFRAELREALIRFCPSELLEAADRLQRVDI
jgi:hypothetical protein